MHLALNSSIPFPEHDALEGAPVKWDLELDENRSIEMAIPLFSYNRYVLFNQIAQIIKLLTVQGVTVSLAQLLSLDKKQYDIPASIKAALISFNTATNDRLGYIPKSLAELIILVSDPMDLPACVGFIHEWAEENGWDFSRIPKDLTEGFEKHHSAIRDALCVITAHSAHMVDDAPLLIDHLQQINTMVKKKHGQTAAEKQEKNPYRRAYARLSEMSTANRQK